MLVTRLDTHNVSVMAQSGDESGAASLNGLGNIKRHTKTNFPDSEQGSADSINFSVASVITCQI